MILCRFKEDGTGDEIATVDMPCVPRKHDLVWIGWPKNGKQRVVVEVEYNIALSGEGSEVWVDIYVTT